MRTTNLVLTGCCTLMFVSCGVSSGVGGQTAANIVQGATNQRLVSEMEASVKYGDARDTIAFNEDGIDIILDLFVQRGFTRAELLDRSTWGEWTTDKVARFSDAMEELGRFVQSPKGRVLSGADVLPISGRPSDVVVDSKSVGDVLK